MRNSRIVAGILIAFLALSASGILGAAEPGPGGYTYDIRLFDFGCGTAAIAITGGASEGEAEIPMKKAGTWWTASFGAGEEIEFHLLIDDLWYPRASGQKYRLKEARSIWIKDGILFPRDPTLSSAPEGLLSILSINLHTYQEADAKACLSAVAELIAKGQVDIIAFQECAQGKDAPVVATRDGVTVRSDNAALLIAEELKTAYGQDYAWRWDWSHYGFSVWEEGAAVMGRASFGKAEGGMRYISASSSKTSIDSRMALYGLFQIPGFGPLTLFSTHVSWGAPQIPQLRALKAYAAEAAGTRPAIICGDFNMKYRDGGYGLMTNDKSWLDAYAAAAPWGGADPTLNSDRIDYQFTASGLVPILSQRVFLNLGGPEAAYKRVSDHCGILVTYRAP